MIPRSLQAAKELAGEGVSVEVIDPRTLTPLDLPTILKSVAKTHRVVIAQEAVRRGGVASDIASLIQQEAFYDLDAPIEIVAGLNIPVPFNLDLEKASVPQVDDIKAAVRRSLQS